MRSLEMKINRTVQNRGIIMNIIMWIVIILGGILGIAVTLGTVDGRCYNLQDMPQNKIWYFTL